MNNELIAIVKKKAKKEIEEIESRSNTLHEYSGDINVFKKLKYVEDRSLTEYYSLLPNLQSCLKNNQIILDIGCGEGKAITEIANTYNSNVIGTVVKKKTTYSIPVRETYADSLPFKDDSFDLVISVHGISWEPNQIQSIKEVCRILKPGGTAHIYLIKFSHSIALFVNDNFWSDINHEEYEKKYEFQENIEIDGCSIYLKEYEFPEECIGKYFKEWGLFIKKNF